MPYKYNPFTGNLDIVMDPGSGTSATSFATDSGTATPTGAGVITFTSAIGLSISGSGSTVTIDLTSPVTVSNGGTGRASLTDGSVLVGDGTNAIEQLVLTDGQLLIGSTGNSPSSAQLSSSDSTIDIANGSGSIDLTAGDSVLTTVTAPDGTFSISSNTLQFIEGSNVTITHSGNALTIAASGSSSPLTTKGDIFVYSSMDTRLPVGADGEVLKADSAQPTGLIWGTAASGDVTAAAALTDNSLIRGDGGAKGIQDSGILIDDTDNMSAIASITLSTGGALRTDTTATNTLLLQAYDVDGAAYTTFATLTAGNTPTMDLDTSVTMGGNAIYYATGTDVPVTDGGTGLSSATAYAVLCGGTTATGAFQSVSGTGSSGEVLTSNGASALPTWQAASGGTVPPKEYWFAAESLQPLETDFAPLEKLVGTNVNVFVRAFANATSEQEEYANGKLQVPGDVDTSGTVTFRIYVMSKTAVASKNTAWTFGHLALNNGEDFDPTTPYTDEDSGDKAMNDTQDNLTEITWTETITNMGWAANDVVLFRISRPAASANDLAGDCYLYSLAVEIPRA